MTWPTSIASVVAGTVAAKLLECAVAERLPAWRIEQAMIAMLQVVDRLKRQVRWAALAIVVAAMPLRADYLTDVGWNSLYSVFGARTPTGVGVQVSIIEAPSGGASAYLPNPTDPQFAGKTITDVSGFGTNSGHATVVGQYYFGNSGIGRGITQIQSYQVNEWFSNRLRMGTTLPPTVETSKVQNHSYVGYFVSPTDPVNVEALRRLDLMIDRDGVTCVVGANNGAISHFNTPIQVQNTNGITVGRSDGNSSFHLTNIDGAGRNKPDLVAPAGFTSNASPMVAASAAALHQMAGANAHASRPETIKSILMAGATKQEFPTWSRVGNEPLDRKYGAGELNIKNSHTIMAGGEHNPFDRLAPAYTALAGWDYEKIAAGGSNWYYFDLSGQSSFGEWSIVAAWNRRIDFNAGVLTPLLANIDLKFYSVTDNFKPIALLQQSISAVDNVEHIYFNELPLGLYALEVTSDWDWTYAVSWLYTPVFKFAPVPEPAGILAAAGMAGLLIIRIRRRRRSSVPE